MLVQAVEAWLFYVALEHRLICNYQILSDEIEVIVSRTKHQLIQTGMNDHLCMSL